MTFEKSAEFKAAAETYRRVLKAARRFRAINRENIKAAPLDDEQIDAAIKRIRPIAEGCIAIALQEGLAAEKQPFDLEDAVKDTRIRWAGHRNHIRVYRFDEFFPDIRRELELRFLKEIRKSARLAEIDGLIGQLTNAEQLPKSVLLQRVLTQNMTASLYAMEDAGIDMSRVSINALVLHNSDIASIVAPSDEFGFLVDEAAAAVSQWLLEVDIARHGQARSRDATIRRQSLGIEPQ